MGIRAWIAERMMLGADRLRAVSHRVLEHLLAAIPEAGSRETMVFPVAIRQQKIKTTSDVLRSLPTGQAGTFPISRPGVTILFVGRLSREKGLDFFLPIFAEVAKTHSAITLLVAGDGPDRLACERAAERLGVRERVVFLGFVRDLDTLYAQADFVVIPSRQESWSRVAVEAIVAGVPVLMTDVGCAGDIVIHEQNGLVVPVADPKALASEFIRMIEHPSLRATLARGTKEAVGRLPSLDEQIRSYVSLWSPQI